MLGPKAVVAIGSCPATTNVFIDSRTLDGPLDKHIPVDVYVPGCPPRPDAIIQGVAKAAEILAERGDKLAPNPIRLDGHIRWGGDSHDTAMPSSLPSPACSSFPACCSPCRPRGSSFGSSANPSR